MHFNSIKVQLEQENVNKSIEGVNYFNSIKVQLEHLSHRHMFTAQVFQFHKGTIRTRQPPRNLY